MGETRQLLFDRVANWICRTGNVKSAVLFGSSASKTPAAYYTPQRKSADLDVHLIVADSSAIENVFWDAELPDDGFCFRASRPASGSVRKLTLVFASGQVDFVVVPAIMMRIASVALRSRLYNRVRLISEALNEMATCLHPGYLFLKGQDIWGNFYRKVCALPGVRLTDDQARSLANASICDALWVLQKLEAGELIAAQHVLHSRLSEINFRLWREVRLRQNLPLPSFGLGRHFETIANEAERHDFCLSARLVPSELRVAVWRTLECLDALMERLDPVWSVPQSMTYRLREYQ
jgi:hypothetical protein